MHYSVCDYCNNEAPIFISKWFINEYEGEIYHYWKECTKCGEILIIDGKRSPWNWGVCKDRDYRDLGDSLKIS